MTPDGKISAPGREKKVHTHAFTKSLNECFHGTSAFGPGIYGYQQHMWYGALSPEAVIFANHPGATSEQSDMRPGYWYGNGVMPAVKQVPGKVGAVYRIPESHPIHFTHIYCPRDRFDRVLKAGNWLLLKKDTGYMGLWCSTELTPFDDTIFHCELRLMVMIWHICASAAVRRNGTHWKNLETGCRD